MEENKDIVIVKPASYTKQCKFCGNTIEEEMQFCTFCGKNQSEEIRRKRKIKRKKKNISKTASVISFFISFIVLIFAVIRMCFFNTLNVSLFGTTYENIIINQTVTIGSLIISMMFLKLGMFLYKL